MRTGTEEAGDVEVAVAQVVTVIEDITAQVTAALQLLERILSGDAAHEYFETITTFLRNAALALGEFTALQWEWTLAGA